MQATIMDKYYNPVRIIDAFGSLIWSDTYIGYGDFELVFTMDENALAYIEEGNYVSIKESDRYMIIEKIEILTSFQEGIRCLLSGRSLESLLTRRIIREELLVNGGVQLSIVQILNANVISPTNANRGIPGFMMNLSNDYAITSQTTQMKFEAGTNVYDAVSKICEERHLGFKVLPSNNGQFVFELYAGRNLSYDQNKNPWIVFSSRNENLEESDMAINTTDLKNCVEIDFRTKKSAVDPNFDPENDEDTDVVIPMVVGDDKKGLDRREIYIESNQAVDAIDKSKFGVAKDRVNWLDYASWDVIYFDSQGYNDAIKDYNNRHASAIKNIGGKLQKRETYYVDPPEGQEDMPSWLLARERIVEESDEDYAKRKAAALSTLGESPKKEDYYSYGWVLTDLKGYDNAVAQAQAAIDAEYAAAMTAALNYAKSLVLSNALMELAEYMTITSFDGKVDPNVNYIYRRDYDLGDVVQIVNQFNFNATTRITSVMFCQDDTNGFIVRPTFESDDIAKVEFDLSDSPAGPTS